MRISIVEAAKSASQLSPNGSQLVTSFSNSSWFWEEDVDCQKEVVNYFYREILKYVVDEHSEIPPDTFDDSDEEPTYNTKPDQSDEDIALHNTLQMFPKIESGSKLRDRIMQSQTLAGLKNKTRPRKSIWNAPNVSETFSNKKKTPKTSYKLPSITVVDESFTMDEEHEDGNIDNIGDTSALVKYQSNPSVVTVDNEGNSDFNPNIADNSSNLLDWFDTDNFDCKRMSIKFNSGAVYCGDVVRHRFQGKGKYSWPNGTFYEGDFEDSTATGFGKLTFPEMSYYRGTVVNCIPEGKGTYCPSNNPIDYSGNWSNGLPDGEGRVSYSVQDFYYGAWEKGQKQGQGTRFYKNKAVYSGAWMNGKPNGKGSMVFENRDFYCGEWLDGKPNGYGEYNWSARLCDGMTFSIKQQYFGNFVNGQRDGYGVQVFGMDGSKAASLFDDNMKSGAGILVCGDGTTIEKKPLFMMDNPVAAQARTSDWSNLTSITNRPSLRPRITTSGIRIRSTVDSNVSVPIQKISSEDLSAKSKNKIEDTFPVVDTSGVPLCLPLHATSKTMDLSYHVERLFLYHKKHASDNEVPQRLTITPISGVRFSKSKPLENLKKEKAPRPSIKIEEKESIMSMAQNNEQRLLTRAVANNYVYLRQVYQKYATLNLLQSCCSEQRNPALNRLRMWQFLRDIDICRFKVSLIEVDLMLLDVPNIHLDTEHDPFETIYFWQFVHCLLLLSYVIYTFTHQSQCASGIHDQKNSNYQEIFRTFIDEVIKPLEGTFKGRALFSCKDLLPIQAVYALYKTIGEPHTARTLLNRICNRRGEAPLACLVKHRKVYDLQGDYKHFVLGGSTLVYVKCEQKDPWELEEAPVLNKYVNEHFYTDLLVFWVLGSRKVMDCISNVCTNVKEDGAIVFIDYQITLLEFYEVLINLAEELSTMKKKAEEVEKKAKEEQSRVNEVVALGSEIGPKEGAVKKKGKKHKLT